MADLLFNLPSGEVTLVAATAKTALSVIAAANHRVKVVGLNVMFKGIVATDTPVLVEVQRITSDGTGTAVTAVKNNPEDGETIQTTSKKNYSAEPTYTANTVLRTFEVHPQSGMMMFLPFGQEIIVPGGGLLGVKCTAAQAQTVAVDVQCEE